MNIGIVTTWFERGAAYVSRNYMSLLEQAGHNIYIFARGGEGASSTNAPEWNKENVTRYSKFINTTIPTRIFFRWIKDHKIDAILFNEQKEYKIVALTKKEFPSIKLGAYVDYYTEESRKWFNFFDFVICNTHRHMEAMESHPQKFYVTWGVDTNLYKPQVKDTNNLVFFHSVGMSVRKGTDVLIDAFIQGNCYKNASLIIHTQIPIEKVSRYKKEDLTKYNITVIEKTVPAPGLYYMGDVYVYPTRLDGLGLTMYEALSCGLPVITSDFPPMNEAVNNDVGRLVKIDDYYCREDAYYYPMVKCSKDELMAAMKWYIENPSELKEQKLRARAYAIKYYNLMNRSEEVSNIFLSAETRTFDEKLYKSYLKTYRQNFKPYVWLFSHRFIGNIVSKLR